MKFGKPVEQIEIANNVNAKQPFMASAGREARLAISEEIMKNVDTAVLDQMPDDELFEQLLLNVSKIANEKRLIVTKAEEELIAREKLDDFRGVGPLQVLLDDDEITDIMVNGADTIYVSRRGQKNKQLTGLSFRCPAHLTAVAQAIARRVGRKIDENTPTVDARLPDGSRVNIVFAPIALDGVCISIRKFPNISLQLDDLTRSGALSEKMSDFMKYASAARLNILISGGTGSGKTTLLNAITKYFDSNDRIITIEDAAEIKVQQPHVIRLETRVSTAEGAGAVTQTDLVKNALRQAPDRIIIGEVRGGEAFDLLQAMNTGHDGSLGTLHANTPRDAISRLENLVLMAGYDLPARAIRQQIASALDLVIQVERMRDGARRIVKISEVIGMEGDVVTMNDLFYYQIESVTADKIIGQFEAAKVAPTCIEKFRGIGAEADVMKLFR